MLQRLVQTTVSSIRTVSRCPETRDPGLDGVKVKLESQLECVEEEDEEVYVCLETFIVAEFCNVFYQHSSLPGTKHLYL